MPRRIRITTPPPELQPPRELPPGQLRQLNTPQRSAIFGVYIYCQKESIPYNLQSISTVFGIPPSTASGVIASRRCRRLQNSDNVDTRGRARELTRSDTAAIGTYLDQCSFKEKALPWEDIAKKAGVVKEYHHKRGIENIQ